MQEEKWKKENKIYQEYKCDMYLFFLQFNYNTLFYLFNKKEQFLALIITISTGDSVNMNYLEKIFLQIW